MKNRSALQFVLIIGIVNFFADFTYEGARGIVGPFLGSLGASAAIIGFVAGLGELLGYGLRSVAGYFADKSQSASGEAFANRLWKPCFRTPVNRSAQDGYLD
jgi:hypothetical protein